jgi:hypothetical protein
MLWGEWRTKEAIMKKPERVTLIGYAYFPNIFFAILHISLV